MVQLSDIIDIRQVISNILRDIKSLLGQFLIKDKELEISKNKILYALKIAKQEDIQTLKDYLTENESLRKKYDEINNKLLDLSKTINEIKEYIFNDENIKKFLQGDRSLAIMGDVLTKAYRYIQSFKSINIIEIKNEVKNIIEKIDEHNYLVNSFMLGKGYKAPNYLMYAGIGAGIILLLLLFKKK